MAGDIFISYRSTEAEVVGQLYDGLINVGGFDPWQMWRDRNSLVAGKEWFSQIEDASSRARVLVAMIGPGWRPKDSKGDWVTRELKAAFAHGIPVLPVLLGDAPMPMQEDLPEELVLLCTMQGLRITNPPVDANFHDLARALRRSGVRPARNTDPWSGAGTHIHIAPICTELQAGLAAGDAGVILLTGRPGSGRSRILRDVMATHREKGTLVGWHAPLHTAARHQCAVLHDWLTDIFEQAHNSQLDKMVTTLRDSGVIRTASCLVPVAELAAMLPLDLRLSLSKSLAAPRRDGIADLSGDRLPLALAARLVTKFGCPDHPLLLLVDDFDFADAKSRDVVRELVRLQGQPGVSDHSPFTLVLNTDDAGATSEFLGLAGQTRPVTARTDPQEFAAHCIRGSSAAAVLSDRQSALLALLAPCPGSFEVEVVLRHLHRRGHVIAAPGGGWQLGSGPADASRLSVQAQDEAIDLVLERAMQQVLETGALVGMSFVADLADAATNGREAGTRPGGAKSMWQQIRESDQDEVIVRCREVDGREVITFTSAVWRSHLANRADKWLRERRTRALAERYRDSAKAGDHYDDWVTGAGLFSRIGANEDAGRAYLIAARLARERLSDDVAAFRYRQARNWFSFAAATDDPTERARALTVMAFACLQAVSLRLRSVSRVRDQIDVTVREELEDDLDIAQNAVAELRHAVRLLPSASGMGLIENLALDLSDSYLSDADKLSARCHSLAAHWAILRGQLLLLGGRTLDQKQPSSDEPEWRFVGALRDAEQGLAGNVRRYLVIVAATGLTQALTIKAEGLAAEYRHVQPQKALKNVVATALFHACRAWLLLDRCGDLCRDVLSAPDVERARSRLVDCLKRLGDSRFPRRGDSRGVTPQLWPEAGVAAGRTPLPDLTRAWAKALAPRRRRHMKQVALRARELAANMAPDDRRLCRDEDIETVAFAHDLFRDVEPSRVLALFRELGMPGGRPVHHDGHAMTAEPDERPVEWIGSAEWTTPVLLHGRLAAVFLDRILDARSRLGSDRFTVIERALATHTIGERDAPALSRLLVVADTLDALAGADDPARTANTEWRRRIDEASSSEPDLIEAYRLCIEARIEYLNRIGTTPGEATSELLNALRSPPVTPAAETPSAAAPRRLTRATCLVKP